MVGRLHGRAATFSPRHCEGGTVKPPANINLAVICRQCSVFTGIGGKLMQCETNGFRRGSIQMQLRTVHRDPGPDEICKMRELGACQVVKFGGTLLVPIEQILARLRGRPLCADLSAVRPDNAGNRCRRHPGRRHAGLLRQSTDFK
jgi:hypothetical protein